MICPPPNEKRSCGAIRDQLLQFLQYISRGLFVPIWTSNLEPRFEMQGEYIDYEDLIYFELKGVVENSLIFPFLVFSSLLKILP